MKGKPDTRNLFVVGTEELKHVTDWIILNLAALI